MASITWGRDVAETYDAGSPSMFAPAMLDPTVDVLAELAARDRRSSWRSALAGWRWR